MRDSLRLSIIVVKVIVEKAVAPSKVALVRETFKLLPAGPMLGLIEVRTGLSELMLNLII